MDKCKCGNCSETTTADFAPGHDQKLRSNIEQSVGGLLALKDLVYSCVNYAEGKSSEDEILRTVRRIMYRRPER